jgi:outer membrane protein assembly factor BamB
MKIPTTLVRSLGAAATVLGLLLAPPPAAAQSSTFGPGDIFLSTEDGQIQWRRPDGTLNGLLLGTAAGKPEGLRLDAASNLYVARWCVSAVATSTCAVGNTVEKFNQHGMSLGTVGSGYNCNPHAVAFDALGNAYVGQADCSGNILKLQLGQAPVAYAAAAETRGTFWIDMAADGCTIFYTSIGPNVKRFDTCGNVQRPDFNLAPLPGGVGHDLRVLPDGGLLVTSASVVARLDATGALLQTYTVPGTRYWVGLDLVGDGTFWVADYLTSDVYRFDIATGAVVASFNTGTASQTVISVAVVKAGAVVCP